MPNDAVHQLGRPGFFGETIPMHGQDQAFTYGQGRFHGHKVDPHVAAPEILAPTVVIAAGHDDRHAFAYLGQGRRNGEAFSGDHPPVGEPEVEQVAVDQQRIAQRRCLVEELQERLFHGWRCDTQMGVGHDEKLVA